MEQPEIDNEIPLITSPKSTEEIVKLDHYFKENKN